MSRKVLSSMVACVLLVIIIGGVYGWNNGYIPGSPIKRTVTATLTDEQQKQFEDRVQDREAKVRQNDADFTSWMELGFAQDQLGKLADAAFAYEQAGRVQPTNGLSFVNLGDVYVKMGKIRQARKAYEQGLANNASYDQYYRKIGDFLAQYYPNDKTDIEALYQRGIQELGLNYNVVSAFADWRERSGNLVGARDLWEQLLTLSPGNAAIQQRVEDINNKLNAQKSNE